MVFRWATFDMLLSIVMVVVGVALTLILLIRIDTNWGRWWCIVRIRK